MYYLINCSGLALSAAPQFANTDWINVFDHRSNDIDRMSAKELLAFSDLNTVHIRGSPCLGCEYLQGIRASVSVLSYRLLNDKPSIIKPVQDGSFLKATVKKFLSIYGYEDVGHE